MDKYVTLVGAEDVDRAGRNILSAADTISRAGESLENALERHASRTEQALIAGLPAEQLELLGLVALLNYETALINAEVAYTGQRGISSPNPATAQRLHALLEKVRGA